VTGWCRGLVPAESGRCGVRAIRRDDRRGVRAQGGSTGGRPAGHPSVDADPRTGALRARPVRCRAGWRRCGTIRSPNSVRRAAASRVEESSTPALAGRQEARLAPVQSRAAGILQPEPPGRRVLLQQEPPVRWELDPEPVPVSWLRPGQFPMAPRQAPEVRTDSCIQSERRGWTPLLVCSRPQGRRRQSGGRDWSNACRGRGRSPGCC
jgi:hypothetical protein